MAISDSCAAISSSSERSRERSGTRCLSQQGLRECEPCFSNKLPRHRRWSSQLREIPNSLRLNPGRRRTFCLCRCPSHRMRIHRRCIANDRRRVRRRQADQLAPARRAISTEDIVRYTTLTRNPFFAQSERCPNIGSELLGPSWPSFAACRCAKIASAYPYICIVR